MITRLITCLLVCTHLSGTATCFSHRCIAAEKSAVPQDIVFYDVDFPIFIRLHLETEGEEFAAPWRRHIASLFKQADTNSDGYWSAAEIGAAPESSPDELRRILQLPALWTADHQPNDDKISLNELERLLIRKEMGPFQAPKVLSTRSGTASDGQLLLSAVDADGDNALTREELLNVTKSLRRHDLNDDGSLSLPELSSQVGRTPTMVRRENPAGELPIAILNQSESVTDVVRELERRYGTNIDLPTDNAGFDSSATKLFDLDNNGSLDPEELRRFLRNPSPAIELRIQLGRDVSFADSVEVVNARTDGVASLRKSKSLVSIVIPGVQIELAQNQDGVESTKRLILRSFSQADRDNNDYLDRKEATSSDIFRDAFIEIDTDRNEMLFKDELVAAIDKQTAIAKVRTRMGISERGRNMFQILDTNRDSRLSGREFSLAADRIMLWDDDGNSSVEYKEIPRTFALSFGPGQPHIRGLKLPDTSAAAVTTNQTASGPVWFSRMDRNNDNELTRREFPGTRAEFSKLDRNDDGTVTPGEADRVNNK